MPGLVTVDVDEAPQFLVLIRRPHNLGSWGLALATPLFPKEQRVVLGILIDGIRTLLFVQLHTFFIEGFSMILNHSPLTLVKFTGRTRLLHA